MFQVSFMNIYIVQVLEVLKATQMPGISHRMFIPEDAAVLYLFLFFFSIFSRRQTW